jgi:hypothetical protein
MIPSLPSAMPGQVLNLGCCWDEEEFAGTSLQQSQINNHQSAMLSVTENS